jgi:heme oxygenase
MTCYKAKYSGTLKANSEIDELKWLNHKDLDIISEVEKIFSFLMKRRAEIKNMFRRLFPAFFFKIM